MERIRKNQINPTCITLNDISGITELILNYFIISLA